MYNKIRKGFTLLELSIVILVIAGIIVTITGSKEVLKKSRLSNARSITQQSVVNNLSDDLIAWFETSLESSFLASEQKNDDTKITKWFDNNKNVNQKNIANAPATTINQPIFVNRGFYDSIPAVRFDGDDYLSYDGSKLVNSSYTIFVVEQRRSNKTENYFLGGSGSSLNNNLHLGYRSDNTIAFAQYNNDMDTTIQNYSTPTPTIHTFIYNNIIGKKYNFISNYTANNSSNSSANLNPLISYSNPTIGKHGSSNYYIGDLAEIIIFKRSLKTEEVNAIRNYLGSKYGIPVS